MVVSECDDFLHLLEESSKGASLTSNYIVPPPLFSHYQCPLNYSFNNVTTAKSTLPSHLQNSAVNSGIGFDENDDDYGILGE